MATNENASAPSATAQPPAEEADVTIKGKASAARRAARDLPDVPDGSARADPWATRNTRVRLTRIDPESMAHPDTGELALLENEVEYDCPTTPSQVKDRVKKKWGGRVWLWKILDREDNVLGGGEFRINAPPRPVFEPDAVEEAEASAAARGFPQGGFDPEYAAFLAQRQAMQAAGGGFPPQGQPQVVRTPYGYSTVAQPGQWSNTPPKSKIEEERERLELEQMREDNEAKRERRIQTDGRFSTMETSMASLRERVEASGREAKMNLDSELRRMREDIDKAKDRAENAEDEAKEIKHALENQVTRLQAALDKIGSDLARQVETMRSDLTRLAADPPKGGGVAELINVMQKSQSEAIGGYQKLVEGVLAQKAGTESKVDDMQSMVTTMGSIANIFGLGGGNAAPKSSAEILAETVNNALPHVTSWMQMRQETGEKIAREVVAQKIDEYLAKEAPALKSEIATSAKTMIMQKIASSMPAPAKPTAPKPALPRQAAPSQAPATKPAAQAPQPAQPTPPPAPEPAPEPEAPAPPVQAAPAVDMEAIKRSLVNQMLSQMKQEAAKKPTPDSVAGWVQFALDNFPADLQERWGNTKTPAEVQALLVEYGDPTLLADLARFLQADQVAQNWVGLTMGHLLAVIRGQEVVIEEPAAEGPASDAAQGDAGGTSV
jgi:ElaB/YqjD/DUF883 family membrane-anchored ribosome-binding protein